MITHTELLERLHYDTEEAHKAYLIAKKDYHPICTI
jgi:hypothetical protein